MKKISVFLILFFLLSIILWPLKTGLAIIDPSNVEEIEKMLQKPQTKINIPYLNTEKPKIKVNENGQINIYDKNIPLLINGIFKFSLIVGSVLAVIMIIIAGFQWLMSAGSNEIISSAKQKIYKAIIGLIILFSSYTLLYTINPELVKLKSLKIDVIQPISIEYIPYEELSAKSDDLKIDYSQANGQSTIINVPLYRQFNKNWGNKVFGYLRKCLNTEKSQKDGVSQICCTTIGAAGCGPTSLAMLLSYKTNKKITPNMVAELFSTQKAGRICNIGFNLNTAGKYLNSHSDEPKLKSLFDNLEIIYVPKKSNYTEKIISLLQQKQPVIGLCAGCTGFNTLNPLKNKTYKGHYIVFNGYNAENHLILVNDPGCNNTCDIKYLPVSQLKNFAGFWYLEEN